MKILIVDDIPDNLVVLKGILRTGGYTDIVQSNSAEEVFKILGFPELSLDHQIDLILMDLMMPDINGIDACRKIKEKTMLQDIPIIMVTARTDMESLEIALSAGAMDYIEKPIRKIELLARVGSALRLKSAMDLQKMKELELTLKNQDLQKASQEIKVLRGFLSICSVCKKIRNDQGLWQQMESYFHQHSDVQFSHGICEVCMKQKYGDIENIHPES